MRSSWFTKQGFWRDALLTTLTLAGLATLERAMTSLYSLPHGRFPAMLIGVMRSRAILQNPGTRGYYEQLASGGTLPAKLLPLFFSHDLIYDDSFRIYRLRPKLDRQTVGPLTAQPTNSFGYVGHEWALPKPPNTRRVALLGDSIAMGMGIDTSHSFATLLENRLNADYPKDVPQPFEVLNFAVRGYVITQIYDVEVEDASRFLPDVYLLELSELTVYGNWSTHLVQLIQAGTDPKYDFLRETVLRSGATKGDSSSTLYAKLAPFRIPVLRETLVRMKSRAEHDHAQFIVMLVPSVEDGALCTQRFDGIREMLESLDIPAIDLLDTFDALPYKEYLRLEATNVHPNQLGERMLVDNLYARLRAHPNIWSALAGDPADTHR